MGKSQPKESNTKRLVGLSEKAHEGRFARIFIQASQKYKFTNKRGFEKIYIGDRNEVIEGFIQNGILSLLLKWKT